MSFGAALETEAGILSRTIRSTKFSDCWGVWVCLCQWRVATCELRVERDHPGRYVTANAHRKRGRLRSCL